MPATDTVTRVTIKLDEETLKTYEKEAEARKRSLESVLSERLRKCQSHTAAQGIYFNDADRQKLVHVTGGHLITSAEDALRRIETAMTVAIGDVKIDIDSRLANRIYHRAKASRMTPEAWVMREGFKSLREACGMM